MIVNDWQSWPWEVNFYLCIEMNVKSTLHLYVGMILRSTLYLCIGVIGTDWQSWSEEVNFIFKSCQVK